MLQCSVLLLLIKFNSFFIDFRICAINMFSGKKKSYLISSIMLLTYHLLSFQPTSFTTLPLSILCPHGDLQLFDSTLSPCLLSHCFPSLPNLDSMTQHLNPSPCIYICIYICILCPFLSSSYFSGKTPI